MNVHDLQRLPLSRSQRTLHVVMGTILDASLRIRKLYLPMFEYLSLQNMHACTLNRQIFQPAVLSCFSLGYIVVTLVLVHVRLLPLNLQPALS